MKGSKGSWFPSLLFLACLVFVPAAAAQDQPTIAKDSVQLTAFTLNVHKGSYDNWSWVPYIDFRVNGPIPSGGQLYVEVSQPGGAAPWVKFDCATEETAADRWWRTKCGGRDIPEDKGSTATGAVSRSEEHTSELPSSQNF